MSKKSLDSFCPSCHETPDSLAKEGSTTQVEMNQPSQKKNSFTHSNFLDYVSTAYI